MALNILPFREEEEVVINIIMDTMIKGMKQIQSDEKVSGTFKELLIILGIPEEEYLSSLKSRISEAKEILNGKIEQIIILDGFDLKLFLHTIVNCYNTPEFHSTLYRIGYTDTFGIIRSLWSKTEEIISYWNRESNLSSIFQKAFGYKKTRKKRNGNKQ